MVNKMFSKKIIRIYVITDNYFLYHGIRELIEDSKVFKSYTYCIEQTSKLPTLIFYHKYHTQDIIITDNYLHCYAVSKYRPEKTLILPCNYDLDKYIECFNDLTNQSYFFDEICFKKLSEKETLLFTLFSEGTTDDKIAIMLNITKKTISSHRRNILQKLNLKNRHELYMYALATKEGLYEHV
ncbi:MULTISPECIES: response regulator transcription factor [Enterobacter]|jgi:DNA-binding CsgD family transcriptional regulator|uniref:DNA-binding response regulator n=2 Tax=Enterobacteriaceae TaxID=543 RepID=A0ABX4VID5_9ENTR|nr:DNA-binding response regulator [Enterobacter bugandensis]PNF53345.1 DNA-binding response regulator [Enterobacter bugandensis]PNF62131.1 DNA-binding response regulator [Enterobacter bugandensis]PNF66769.1 DNA-binding response regulator [Enterobacter bugandensis]RKN87220.1 DNA-binding response regulator [Enterobacter bugandensis]